MKELEILTKSDKETKKIGAILAKEIIKNRFKTATVLSLEGDLGVGKTTFTQGFAKGLGVKEIPKSPTFVIMQAYSVKHKARSVERLIHIDAYRLASKDFKVLGWEEFIKNKNNIILVEWGNKIKNILPKNFLRIVFEHISPSQRLIKVVK